MTEDSGPPLLFDPRRRAAARDKAHARFAGHDFLYRFMLDGLLERLDDVKRGFARALIIGCPDDSARDALVAKGIEVTCLDPGARNAAAVNGIQAEEDALPFSPNSFDLVLGCGTLDSVNDLPGALIVIRNVLKPDGLFLGVCLGAGSLPRLRQALLSAEGDSPRPHIHPQTDVRAMGDLLSRAGFAMPVADSEALTVRYSSMLRLMHDLRYMAAGNVMSADRRGPLTRTIVARAAAYFADAADPDGKTAEMFSILHMSGWKPDASQPAPARRGSATVSLAQALKSRG
ncbi:methyltransferase domain-containing protein [Sphingobium fluviale]|uniref:Methyltransferase domain-containing protein n=1 Tax=Sphingobium fluviale TaxID=2506423 RepID=A0A4Q1KHL4_9SPHN|nr:methyltransferase domain-containing protein [Sphingobium fluviale]RXR28619.1 methyltransferase domain-containing protein [Sphingobium fluviale]